MKINLNTFCCNYEFLVRKCSHLPDEIQGQIAEDLFLNDVSFVEASTKYNMNLYPESLFDLKFLTICSPNPIHAHIKKRLRTDFLKSTKLSFKNQDDEDCFFSLFLSVWVALTLKKELHFLYKSKDELSAECLLAWAKSLDKTNHPFYNKNEVKNVIEVLTNRIKNIE